MLDEDIATQVQMLFLANYHLQSYFICASTFVEYEILNI